MKKLMMFLFTLMLIGCGVEKDSNGHIAVNTGNSSNPEIRIIDSCEYVTWGYGLAHKGNCKFCEARRKEEIRKLIDEMFMMQD